jgi:quercetin dioxygenase-like cupin family protein
MLRRFATITCAALAALSVGVFLQAQAPRPPSPDIGTYREGVSVAVHSLLEEAKRNPIDPATGRRITTIESGRFSTVTLWQFKTGITPHVHREHDEVIYCESGEGIALLGSEKRRMRAGDFVVIPPGVPHGVTVTSRRPMRGISVFSPVFDGTDRFPSPP